MDASDMPFSSQASLSMSFSKLSTIGPSHSHKGKPSAFVEPDAIFPKVEPTTSLQETKLLRSYSFSPTPTATVSKELAVSDSGSNHAPVSEMSDADTHDSDPNSDVEPIYASFGTLRPQLHTFTEIFPEYPQTHKKGHATIIELPPSILTPEKIQALVKGIQYSFSNQGGGGKRVKENVSFFNMSSHSDDAESDEDDSPSMNYYSRSCAGVKVCEFFPDMHQHSHTTVDPEGLEWAPLLAEQERTQSNIAESKVDKLYDQYIDDICDRPKLNGISTCGGKTVIRSRGEDVSNSLYHRLFIGCENWRHNEKNHTRISLDGCDPGAVLRRWGRNRCYVHADILDKLNIVWDELERMTLHYISKLNNSYI
jgi:hypothetical protein